MVVATSCLCLSSNIISQGHPTGHPDTIRIFRVLYHYSYQMSIMGLEQGFTFNYMPIFKATNCLITGYLFYPTSRAPILQKTQTF